MIVDRLILFFFGPGPQAQQEEAALAEGSARKGAPFRANASGEVVLDRRFKRTSDKLKNITRRKKNKKTEDKEKAARAKKEDRAGAPKRKTPKKLKKKAAAKKSQTKKRATKTPVKRKAAKKAVVKKSPVKKAAVKKVPVKKVVTKKRAAPKAKGKKNAKRDIHVLFRTEEKLWGLLREGSQRSDSLYLHQEDAIEAGRSRAQFEEVNLITHRKNGAVRSTWSPR